MTAARTLIAVLPSFIGNHVLRVHRSPLALRLANGALWSLLGAVLSRVAAVASSIVVAHLLGKTVFGELGVINSTVGMFQVFAGFGLGMTATKYIAEYRTADPAKAGRILALTWVVAAATGGVCVVLLLIFAGPLAAHVLAAPHLARLLRMGAILLLLGALNGSQLGSLAGLEAFKTIAKINVLGGILSFPVMLVCVACGGIDGAVWGLTLSQVVNWFLCHAALRRAAIIRGIRFSLGGCRSELPLLWHFSLPSVLTSILFSPVNWACNALLVNQPHGYSEVAVYTAANQWRTAILFLPSMIGGIVLPILTDLHHTSDTRRYNKVLWYNLLLNGAVALCAALPISMLSYTIMSAYGVGFGGGYQLLILLSLSSVLMAVNNVVGQALASRDEMWLALLFNGLWSVVLLLSSLWLIPVYGALGLGWASLGAYVCHTIWQLCYLYFAAKPKRMFARQDLCPDCST